MPACATGEGISIRPLLLGRPLGGLVLPLLLLDGVSRLAPGPIVTAAMGRMGYGSSEALAQALGDIAALTTMPPTSILGAIIWIGYLGNIVATQLRIF